MKPLLITALAFALTACAQDLSVKDDGPMKHDNAMLLAGSEWGLEDAPNAFVQFGAEGKLTGHGNCNRFFGSYSQDGQALSIGPIGATKMMCPPEIMQVERRLLGALDAARSIEATHLVLILKDADGTELLTLQRRDWD